MSNKLFVFALIFYSAAFCSDNDDVYAEYCLYVDNEVPEYLMMPLKWKLKRTNLIRDIDMLKLSEEQEDLCLLRTRNFYINLDGHDILYPTVGAFYTYYDKEMELKRAISAIKPQEYYEILETYFYELISMTEKNPIKIPLEWEQYLDCKNPQDSIDGKLVVWYDIDSHNVWRIFTIRYTLNGISIERDLFGKNVSQDLSGGKYILQNAAMEYSVRDSVQGKYYISVQGKCENFPDDYKQKESQCPAH